jgi:hypothetical protein
VDIATESERISKLKEMISVKQGLIEAGFVTDQRTGQLHWECCGLRIDACEDWMYGWQFIATAVTPRIALCDEFKLPPQMPRCDLLARLLRCWRDVFKAGQPRMACKKDCRGNSFRMKCVGSGKGRTCLSMPTQLSCAWESIA